MHLTRIAVGILATSFILGNMPSAYAAVIIDDWTADFIPTGSVASSAFLFTDGATGFSSTMTIEIDTGSSLNIATHLGINGDTGANIDVGEALTFSWDNDVTLASMRLFQGSNKSIIISSPAFSTITTTGTNISFGDLAVPAGTAVKVTGGPSGSPSGASAATFRIDQLNFTIIPEPSSVLLMGAGMLALAMVMFRRRKA